MHMKSVSHAICGAALLGLLCALTVSVPAARAADIPAKKDCEPLRVAKHFLDDIGTLDMEGALGLMDDSLEMQDPWGNKMTKAQLRAWYVQEWPKLTKQRTTRIVGTTCEGDRVAIESESQRALADGSTYRNIYHHLFVVRNGKIVVYHQYLNTEAFTQSVKMAPAAK
jgi:uncharacterized protein